MRTSIIDLADGHEVLTRRRFREASPPLLCLSGVSFPIGKRNVDVDVDRSSGFATVNPCCGVDHVSAPTLHVGESRIRIRNAAVGRIRVNARVTENVVVGGELIPGARRSSRSEPACGLFESRARS